MTEKYILTQTEIDVELQFSMNTAADLIQKEKGEELIPHLILLVSAGNERKRHMVVFADGFSSNNDKDQKMSALGLKYGKERTQVIAAFLITECWMSTQLIGEERKGQPKDDPDRQEALVVSAYTIDGAHGHRMAMITRAGNEVGLAPAPDMDGSTPNRMLVTFFKFYAIGFLMAGDTISRFN